MKKILYFLALIIGTIAFGQDKKNPLLLINGSLESQKLIEQDTKNIKKMNVYTVENILPATLKNFQNYSQNGLVNVELKSNHFDQIPLKKLNIDFKISADQSVFFNDIKIENTDISVITNAIEFMEVQQKDGEKFLHLYTYTKEVSPNAMQ